MDNDVSPLATDFNHFQREYLNCQLSTVNCPFAACGVVNNNLLLLARKDLTNKESYVTIYRLNGLVARVAGVVQW